MTVKVIACNIFHKLFFLLLNEYNYEFGNLFKMFIRHYWTLWCQWKQICGPLFKDLQKTYEPLDKRLKTLVIIVTFSVCRCIMGCAWRFSLHHHGLAPHMPSSTCTCIIRTNIQCSPAAGLIFRPYINKR